MDKLKLQKYIDDGLSIYKIAGLEDKSASAVRHWLKKYELKTHRAEGKHLRPLIGNITVFQCKACMETKPVAEFYETSKRGELRPFSYCKPCARAYSKADTKRDDLKAQCVKYKGGKCEICGYSKYFGALEFHHRDRSQKDFSISDKIRRAGSTFETLKPELDKCSLLCSNCHKEVHGNVAKLD